MKFTLLIVCILSTIITVTANSERVPSDGLYDTTDYVESLYADEFEQKVYNQEHASILKFYTRYCAFCRKFVPTWRSIAKGIKAWDERFVKVYALDCAIEGNRDLCRRFGFTEYSQFRYFEPHTTSGAGERFEVSTFEGKAECEVMNELLTRLKNIKNPPSYWPNFQLFTEFDDLSKLFEGHQNAKFGFLINVDDDNIFMGYRAILHFYNDENVVIRVTQREGEENGLSVVDAETKSETKILMDGGFLCYDILRAINNYLLQHGYQPTLVLEKLHTPKEQEFLNNQFKEDAEIFKQMKEFKGSIYQSDLEEMIKFSLFQEVTRYKFIKDKQIPALKAYLQVLIKYFPFQNENGVKFLTAILNYLKDAGEGPIDVEIFNTFLNKTYAKYEPIFSSNRWVGCYSTKKWYRGFPCGIWTAMHYLTVQSAASETNEDPLEILRAMYGYVKYFFGCHHCANHFQTMAKLRKIWDVKTKDEAILWLWESHNEVNNRLHGDPTEDPEHLKLQYPSEELCPECRKENGKFDNVKVLEFLKRSYGTVSFIGMPLRLSNEK